MSQRLVSTLKPKMPVIAIMLFICEALSIPFLIAVLRRRFRWWADSHLQLFETSDKSIEFVVESIKPSKIDSNWIHGWGVVYKRPRTWTNQGFDLRGKSLWALVRPCQYPCWLFQRKVFPSVLNCGVSTKLELRACIMIEATNTSLWSSKFGFAPDRMGSLVALTLRDLIANFEAVNNLLECF